jgi:hypothetical protein
MPVGLVLVPGHLVVLLERHQLQVLLAYLLVASSHLLTPCLIQFRLV